MLHRPVFRLRLLHLLILFSGCLCPAVPARADNPLLDRDGNPNALFWVAGAATVAADKPLYDLVQRLDSPVTHRAAVTLNYLGDGRVQLGTLALLALAGSGSEKRIARRGLQGMVAGGLVVFALKNAAQIRRPWSVRKDGVKESKGAGPADALDAHPDRAMSFPSGHSMAAFSLATVWANERPRDRELAYALAALASLSRISLKQHWPSDVFFGAALGVAAGNAGNRGVPFGLMFRVR